MSLTPPLNTRPYSVSLTPPLNTRPYSVSLTPPLNTRPYSVSLTPPLSGSGAGRRADAGAGREAPASGVEERPPAPQTQPGVGILWVSLPAARWSEEQQAVCQGTGHTLG